MKELEIIGRAIAHETPDRPPARDHQGWGELRRREVLTLSQASALSGVPIHMLKLAIHAGRLLAAWRGRYYISRSDLDAYVRKLSAPT